jgi:gluconate kinase
MILFLFGRPGSGKSVVGIKLAESLDTIYFDCDECYTESDRLAIRTNSFTYEQSDLFLERIIQTLRKMCLEDDLVIANQSLFQEKHRRRLKEELDSNIFLVCLDVPISITLNRVRLRGMETEHFYGIEQYMQQLNGFEDVKTCDLIVENIGSVEETVRTIKQKLLLLSPSPPPHSAFPGQSP